MKLSPKFVIRVAGTLTLICLVVAALLGAVNNVTAPRIAAINQENTKLALSQVAPPECDFSPIELDDALVAAAAEQGVKLTEAYTVTKGGEPCGYAFKVVAGGSQGDIEMIVGVDGDNAVTGVSVVSNSETAGIGSKVMGNAPLPSGVGVLDQFIGKSGAGSLAVKVNVDAISGATVSSKGVTKGVNGALAAAQALGSERGSLPCSSRNS